MSRRFGRSPRGTRAHDARPVNYGENLTILGALNLDGIVAAMTITGATTKDVFLAFVTEVLCPALREGSVVIMDNLAAHRTEEVRAAIETAGSRVLFLPPYSPDLNPIEPAWSKIKTYLRSVGARSIELLERAVGEALRLVTSDDCRGWFRYCGYDLSA
jgi:transposase